MTDIAKVPNDFFKNLATHIYNKTYDTECRIETYHPYPHPRKYSQEYKISTYSLRDNPTGIYVRKDEELVVMVENTYAQKISILVQDLDQGFGGPSYSLSEGVNVLKMTSKGLVYVLYYTENGDEQPVKIHFASGKINGVYRLGKHTERQYISMLTNAVCPYMDLIGNYSHLTFTVTDLKEQKSTGEELIGVYENVVRWQQEFMGLIKYRHKIPNHMYFMMDVNGKSPYATTYYTAYPLNTMKLMCNATQLMQGENIWGAAHEAGHVNQLRPGFKWIGMTEVSNNVMSLYVQTKFGNMSRLQEKGIYTRSFTNLRNQNIPHSTHNDVFAKLVAFWQLQLYYAQAQEKHDFYPDLYEALRKNPNPETNGACQLAFIKVACQIAQEDLTDFFESWGMLTPVSAVINDYVEQEMIITQEMINRLRSDIQVLKLPK
ncbi:MAG: M60 family metallopeptidase, partial [Bacteroidales bacterium]